MFSSRRFTSVKTLQALAGCRLLCGPYYNDVNKTVLYTNLFTHAKSAQSVNHDINTHVLPPDTRVQIWLQGKDTVVYLKVVVQLYSFQ